MTIISNWLSQLEPRERHTLLVGALVLSALLLYFLVWEPFQAARAQLANIIASQERDLQWMQQAAGQIRQLRATQSAKPTRADTTSLLAIIDSSTRAGDLAKVSKRIEPQGETGVRVSFETVRFTFLVQWLAVLHTQHGIQVQALSLERDAAPDMVKARLTLGR